MEDPTLLIHWLFSCLAVLVMSTRLIYRMVAKQSCTLGDYLTMAAIVCCLVRLGLIHVVLTYGTNNVSAAIRATHTFTAEEIRQRTLGSKLSLVNRVFYNSYLWLQKLVLLDVYRRLLLNLSYEKITIISYLVVLFAAYVACQVTTFSECKPFHLYWQVVPSPGTCAQAQVQLIVVGVMNIITDFMLLVLPIPLVITLKKTPWLRKLRLLAIFLLGTFIICITIVRLPINSAKKDSQISRTTWASIELLTAAIVVNAPTLYGLWNKQKQQKSSSRSYGTGGLAYHSRVTNVSAVRRHQDIEDDDYMMTSPHRKSTMNGIMQTKEVIISEFRDTGRGTKGYINFPDDVENVSSSSSQRGILKE